MEQHTNPHRCTKILYFTWKIFTCLFTHVMLVTLVVAYCMLGAVTFEHLEKPNEILVKKSITNLRKNLTEDLWSHTKDMIVLRQDNWTSHALRKLKIFENDLVLAMRKSGWDGSEDFTSLQWTFTGSLFYSIIVITTIGYGHIAPKTQLGKVTTIFYAIVGIPLMLLCLSNIGDIMAHSFRFLYWRVCCYSCTKEEENRRLRRRPRGHARMDGKGNKDVVQINITSGNYGAKQPFPKDLEVQNSIFCNKYAIDTEDFNKGNTALSTFPGLPLSASTIDIGAGGRRSAEHLHSSPRIMSPMGFIVPRHNQSKMMDYYDYDEENLSPPIKPVPIWLCVFLVVSYIVGGAFLFSDWENWGYADSAYFCFITLTTIGFGDFVPAQRVSNNNGEMSIALCSLYLLFGIALLAMSFNLVQEEVITNVKAVAKHLGIIKSDGEYID